MDIVAISPESEEMEFDDMGSHNHSMVQANLAHLLKLLGDYTVFIELSLDVKSLDQTRYKVKDEAVPNLSLYPKRPLSIPYDILQMTEMPLLAVGRSNGERILSPGQGTASILEKFDAYFALGIQSSWLVDPLTQTVHVYQSPTQQKTFSGGQVVDPRLDINIPLADIVE